MKEELLDIAKSESESACQEPFENNAHATVRLQSSSQHDDTRPQKNGKLDDHEIPELLIVKSVTF